MTTTKTGADTVRVYLPDTFVFDAWECDPDLWPLWEKIIALPEAKRGRGTGRWADLTPDEAKSIKAEADYRAEYWLTDAYGAQPVASHERTRGLAAQRVAVAIAEATR